MRLIDADALCRLARNSKYGVVDWKDIIRMPTVDAVPVKHGEWIPMQTHYGGNYYYMGCSVCSHPMPTDSKFDFMDEEDNKFCYNCGAKMDLMQSNDSNVLEALDGKEQEDADS